MAWPHLDEHHLLLEGQPVLGVGGVRRQQLQVHLRLVAPLCERRRRRIKLLPVGRLEARPLAPRPRATPAVGRELGDGGGDRLGDGAAALLARDGDRLLAARRARDVQVDARVSNLQQRVQTDRRTVL